MTIATTTQNENTVLTTWLNKSFVSDLTFELQLQKFTTKAMIPPGSGKAGRFIIFSPPTVHTGGTTSSGSYSGLGSTALTEGLGTGNEITSVTETSAVVTVAEYGEFVPVTTLWDYAAVAGARDRIRKRMRDGALYTVDNIVRYVSMTSENILYCYPNYQGSQVSGTTLGASFTRALGNQCNAAAIIAARKTLYAYKSHGLEGVPGHPSGQYAAVLTPMQELDIVTEITTMRVYWSNMVVNVPGPQGQERMVKGYLGSIYQTACYTTNAYSTALCTGASAEVGFVYGDGAVGAMAIENMEPQIILNGVDTPYKNRNTIAWHLFFGSVLIDGSRVVKLYSASA